MVVGMLTFGGVTERRPNQVSIDVQCLDGDGRQSIESASGFLMGFKPGGGDEKDITALGRMATNGDLQRLVGSMVAVPVSVRTKDGVIYRSVEGIFPLARASGV